MNSNDEQVYTLDEVLGNINKEIIIVSKLKKRLDNVHMKMDISHRRSISVKHVTRKMEKWQAYVAPVHSSVMRTMKLKN